MHEVGPAVYEYSERGGAGGAAYWRRVLACVELRTLHYSAVVGVTSISRRVILITTDKK
jgi:hypothetical protein